MFSVPPHRGTDSDFHRFPSPFFFVDVHLFRAGEELCEQAEGTTMGRPSLRRRSGRNQGFGMATSTGSMTWDDAVNDNTMAEALSTASNTSGDTGDRWNPKGTVSIAKGIHIISCGNLDDPQGFLNQQSLIYSEMILPEMEESSGNFVIPLSEELYQQLCKHLELEQIEFMGIA